MRIAAVTLAGFRGARNPVTVEVPSGALVVTGPNGSGKSTLCDSIEYALTGTMSRYSSKTEKGERLEDYLWWRGDSSSSDRYVRLILAEGAEEIAITRTPSGVSPAPREIAASLCDERAPEDPLLHLCRSFILRDELIGQLSLDLSETERFHLVRSTIGAFDFSDLERRIDAASKMARERSRTAESQYDAAVTRKSTLLQQLSEVRAAAAKSQETSKAERILRSFLGDVESDLTELASSARLRSASLRAKTDHLGELLSEARQVDAARRQIPPAIPKEVELAATARALEGDVASAAQSSAEMRDELLASESRSPVIAALANLRESGRRVGLRDGRCPLCGLEISQEEFAAHLEVIGQEIQGQDARISNSVQRYQSSRAYEQEARAKLQRARQQLAEARAREKELDDRWAVLRKKCEELEVESSDEAESFIVGVEQQLENGRESLYQLEEAITVVEAFLSVGRANELEAHLKRNREEIAAIDSRLESLRAVEGKLKEARAQVLRLSGELVDEHLASVSPLLKELYARVRPHVDWREVAYHVRGDVRRFLSLRVGGELNPAFIFSSGQRRAAGVAFLLAVFLSRSWSRLRTLVLDDPVQHIDDFRALHFVEVLAAVRRAGYQIVCTVEDPALADLLCRRLGGGDVGDVQRVDLEYLTGEGVHVAETRLVQPFPQRVLLSA